MVEINYGYRLLDDPLYQKSLQKLYTAFSNWEALEGKTILISGATGMIGLYLIDALMMRNMSLSEAHKTHIIGIGRDKASAKERFSFWKKHAELTFLPHNIQNSLPQITENVNYIVHAASTTHPQDYATHPIDTILTNILGTKNLLDFSVTQPGCRFVLLSSVEVYGENRGDIEAFHEHYCGYIDCNTLRAGYPEAKRVSETLCQAFIEEKDVDAVILRLPRCYGPTMRLTDTKAISQFLKKAASEEDIIMKSEGNQLYSYAHVCDAVQGILWTLVHGERGAAYNLGNSSSDLLLRDLAALCAAQASTHVVFEMPKGVEKKGYSTASKALMDGNKLTVLGWSPKYDISLGVAETVKLLRRRMRSEGNTNS